MHGTLVATTWSVSVLQSAVLGSLTAAFTGLTIKLDSICLGHQLHLAQVVTQLYRPQLLIPHHWCDLTAGCWSPLVVSLFQVSPAHAGWLGAGAGSGSDSVPAHAGARARQGADAWRALEALLRITGSELQDVVLSDQHSPETYYTVVRASVVVGEGRKW